MVLNILAVHSVSDLKGTIVIDVVLLISILHKGYMLNFILHCLITARICKMCFCNEVSGNRTDGTQHDQY
jgi:hypothetical protein